MYIRAQHRNPEFTEALEFIRNQAFGILIAQLNKRSWGTHLPFIVNKDLSISSHMAKANPLAHQWLNEGLPEEVLCIFKGAGAYISGSWYTHEEVSTYNYTALHVYCTVNLCSPEQTLSDLETLMHTHESRQKNPKFMSEYSSETLKQARGVLGFNLEVREFHFAQKLSQERTNDRDQVIAHLKEGNFNEQAVAAAMQDQNNKPV